MTCVTQRYNRSETLVYASLIRWFPPSCFRQSRSQGRRFIGQHCPTPSSILSQLCQDVSIRFLPQNLTLTTLQDVLVIPTRPVPRLTDLTTPELTSLITSVQNVGRVIERAYGGDALTVACQVYNHSWIDSMCSSVSIIQDGKAAGQSIPHVHFHLLPRKYHGDFFSQKMDDIYPALEQSETRLPHDFHHLNSVVQHHSLKVDADEDRVPRTLEEMEKEATWLRGFFTEDKESGDNDAV